MSLKSRLMPMVTQRLLSRHRLLRRRARAERDRVAGREPNRVHDFHQLDDPCSALAAESLPGQRDKLVAANEDGSVTALAVTRLWPESLKLRQPLP